jgi:hypothetical protein
MTSLVSALPQTSPDVLKAAIEADADVRKAEADADVRKAEADVRKADADVRKAEADVRKAEAEAEGKKADMRKVEILSTIPEDRLAMFSMPLPGTCLLARSELNSCCGFASQKFL